MGEPCIHKPVPKQVEGTSTFYAECQNCGVRGSDNYITPMKATTMFNREFGSGIKSN